MRAHRHLYASLAAVAVLSSGVSAQTPTHVLRGTTRAANGAPVGGVNIFLLESLDATLSDSAGRFVIRTGALGSVTLVARRIGFAPATIVAPGDTNGSIDFVLQTQAAVLVP